jgi:hypothetical protein
MTTTQGRTIPLSLRPTQRRALARWVHGTFGVTGVRACQLAQFSRAAWYRGSQAKDQSALRMRIRELAHLRPRFGYLRIWVLLRREGWVVNTKRVRRLSIACRETGPASQVSHAKEAASHYIAGGQ